MALGTVKASGGLQTQLIQDASSEIVSRAASGLGDAVNRLAQTGLGYLNSRTDIERVYDARAQGSIALDLDTKFVQYQQDRAKEFTEFSRERAATPLGMTKDYDARLAESEAAFLKTVPPRFQEEVKNRLAEDRATRVGSAFTSELSLLDTADTNTLNTNLNTLGSSLKGGIVELADAEASWEETVNKSGLDSATKLQFIESGKATLQGLQFGTLVEQGALGLGVVADGSNGADVVAAGLLPQERGVLNAISKRESSGYNIWNGGTTFEGYEDHPAASMEKPGESTAAGRYQFTYGTWRTAVASYERANGIKVADFSPEWQDRVALHWAEVVYNQWNKTGLPFKEALASGDPAQLTNIRRVLGNPKNPDDPNSVEWQGWGDASFGGDATAADAAWVELITGQTGYAGGGTGPATLPNVWTDPQFAGLSLDAKMGFANAAAAAADQQKAAMAASLTLERKTFLDQAYNAGYSGDPAIVAALQSSRLWDAEAQAKYNAGQDVLRASQKGSSEIAAALGANSPLATGQAKDFGNWFGAERFQGLMSGDAKAYQDLVAAVGIARIFPEGSVDALRAALGNPEVKGLALETLAMAHLNDSFILKRSGFSDDDIGMIQLYANYASRAGSQETAMADFEAANNTAALLGKTPAAITKEADEFFNEAYPSPQDLVSNFVGWVPWFFGEDDITSFNPAVEDLLAKDSRAAWRDGYAKTGTAEGAEAYMQSYIDNTFGLTYTRSMYFGGNGREGTALTFEETGPTVLKPVLMKYPPEKYFKDYDGASDFVYEELAKFAEGRGAQKQNAVLISDETTDRLIREGKTPTYKVVGMGAFGEAVSLPGRFGGDWLKAIGEEDLKAGGYREQDLGSIAKASGAVERLNNRIVLTEGMGGDTSALREELSKTEASLTANKLAALENGHLSLDMPQTVDDPKLDDLAAIVAESYVDDATVQRKIAAMLPGIKAGSKDEAQLIALGRLLAKDYKLLPEVGLALAQKVLEKY